jgi:hypothetical protein
MNTEGPYGPIDIFIDDFYTRRMTTDHDTFAIGS